MNDYIIGCVYPRYIHLPTHIVYVCLHIYIYLSISIHPSTYLPDYLLISVCPSIHPSIYLVYLFIYLSIHPPVCYTVYIYLSTCVFSPLRKKPIFKFMPPFSLHLSLTFYRKWNTVADPPMGPSSQSVMKLMYQHILSLSLSLCCAAHSLWDPSSPARDWTCLSVVE